MSVHAHAATCAGSATHTGPQGLCMSPLNVALAGPSGKTTADTHPLHVDASAILCGEVSLAVPDTLEEILLTASDFQTGPADTTRATIMMMILILMMVIAPIHSVFVLCQALC